MARRLTQEQEVSSASHGLNYLLPVDPFLSSPEKLSRSDMFRDFFAADHVNKGVFDNTSVSDIVVHNMLLQLVCGQKNRGVHIDFCAPCLRSGT